MRAVTPAEQQCSPTVTARTPIPRQCPICQARLPMLMGLFRYRCGSSWTEIVDWVFALDRKCAPLRAANLTRHLEVT